jgi:hypothetical protein
MGKSAGLAAKYRWLVLYALPFTKRRLMVQMQFLGSCSDIQIISAILLGLVITAGNGK